jgi:hypothetical protein
MTDHTPLLSIDCEPIETTWDWLDDDRLQPGPGYRTWRPGPLRYWIDGVQVDKETFDVALRQWEKPE